MSEFAYGVKITVKNLNFFYGPVPALKDINLDIKEKQITALIGPSGCGKSTFLRTLNRMNELIPNTRITGSILLDGQDIYAPQVNPVNLRQRVGMVFQRPNPFPKSIFENVAFGPKVLGTSARASLWEIVEKSLRGAALWEEVKDQLHKPATELSLGQQQRLCIARVLALDPEVIMLDEPCSGLDPISTRAIEETLYELKKKYTIVIVPHNIQQASRIADRVAFFLGGELIEEGPVAQIFTKPQKKITEDYLSGKYG